MNKNSITGNINDFSVARPGDRVWIQKDSYEGYGEIIAVEQSNYPIVVKANYDGWGNISSFTLDGKCYKTGPQCLFWSKPEIIAPPRPKRMVKKVVEVRPVMGSYLKVLTVNLDDTRVDWCGPIQQVEILVEEE